MKIGCYDCKRTISNVRAGETIRCPSCGAWNTAPNDRGRDNAFNDGMEFPIVDRILDRGGRLLDKFGI